ncbi:MAG: hypothetical protein H0V44_13690, partial [Planctomycetes bacterium]|nr:hypothetical protein [Planctomycetota bacterium]
MSDVIVPSTLLRTDAVYRSFGTRAQRIGCGFWLAHPSSDESGVINPFCAVSLVLRGSAVFTDHRRVRTTLRPGMAYARLPGRRHSLVYGPSYAECWIDLGVAVGAIPETTSLIHVERTVFSPGIDLSLVRRIDRTLTALRAADVAQLPVLAIELLAIVGALVSLE